LPFSKPAKTLSRDTRPPADLLGVGTLSSIVGTLVINQVFAAIALAVLTHSSWYPCRKWTLVDIPLVADSYEASTIYAVSFSPKFRKNRSQKVLNCLFRCRRFTEDKLSLQEWR
jgi:hypothetical protein